MTRVAIVYHSGYGHTKLQAEAVRDGAASVDGVEALLLDTEEGAARLDELDACEAIIIGCPTYMGGPSAAMKTFMDASSQKWLTQGWKDKIAGGFTNSGSFSGDKVTTLLAFMTLAVQHGMIWVGVGDTPGSGNSPQGPGPEVVNRMGGAMGAMARCYNGPPGPDNPPSGDITTAQNYGRRVAEAAKRWNG